MSEQDYRASVDKQIEALRQLILGQVRELHDMVSNIRAELHEVRLRQEKSESVARRF
jgi:hypothetical protein